MANSCVRGAMARLSYACTNAPMREEKTKQCVPLPSVSTSASCGP